MSSKLNVKKGGNKISQNDLRRMMSDHKKKLMTAARRIESPLAKYNDDGSLKCAVCDSIVSSEAVWIVHLNSKKHKDNIALRKSALLNPVPFPVEKIQASKRPTDNTDEGGGGPPKKLKGILKKCTSDIFEDSEKGNKEHWPKSDEAEQQKEFDESSDALPEGFFDDPVLDAKARNVEFKDPIQEEWEKFQKEIREENTLSSQIIQDDTEIAVVERQISEVDEQLRNWSRVLDLEMKKEKVQANTVKARDVKMEVSDVIDDSDEETDEFLDWRAKKSFA